MLVSLATTAPALSVYCNAASLVANPNSWALAYGDADDEVCDISAAFRVRNHSTATPVSVAQLYGIVQKQGIAKRLPLL